MFLVKDVNLMTIITVYQKLIYYHPLFQKIQLLIIYSRFLHQLIFLFCTQCLPHVLNNDYVSPQDTGIKSISDNVYDLNTLYASLNTSMNDLIILSKEQKSINVASSKRTYADLFDSTSIKQHSTLLAKSISKEIKINSDKNRNIIFYNISSENILNEILDDLNMSSHFIGKIKLNTKNFEAYKVTMDDVITPYLYSEFYNLPNRVDKYPKVFLRPDLSFDERVKRPILTIGAENMTKHTRCIFNNRTSQYELRYIVTNDDDTSYIDWKTSVSYSDADYLRWSKQAKNINKNRYSDIRNNDISHSN